MGILGEYMERYVRVAKCGPPKKIGFVVISRVEIYFPKCRSK